MAFNINDPKFYEMHNVWVKECEQLKIDLNSKTWQKFIKKCGLKHLSMSRLEVENEKIWMLAKIKYGI
jgi:hypothetical protein